MTRRPVAASRLFTLIVAIAAGTFGQAPRVRFASEQIPSEAGPVLAVADVDSDGDVDLVTSGANSVYLNDGAGRYSPHPTPSSIILPYQGPTHRRRLVAGDFTGDGQVDLLGTGPTGLLTLWQNVGAGAFSTVAAQLPALLVTSLAAGDLDGDGDVDALCATPGTLGTTPSPVVVLANNGTGGFTLGSVFLVGTGAGMEVQLSDLDQDGDLDAFCVGGGVRFVAINNGGASFSTTALGGAPSPGESFSVGDIDADGLPDVVFDSMSVSQQTNAVQVLRNAGGGTFTAVVVFSFLTGPCRSILADVNNDGRAELLRFHLDGCDVHVLVGGAFPTPLQRLPVFGITQPGPFFPTLDLPPISVVDVDGDQDRDLIVQTQQGNVILAVDPALGLRPLLNPISAPASLGPFETLDFDLDGDLDLVASDSSGVQRLAPPPIMINDGTGRFAPPLTVVCPQCMLPGVAWQFFDADGDGDNDLYWVNNLGTYQVAINTGGVFVASPTPAGVAPAGTKILPLDVDADGDLDLIVGVDFALGVAGNASLLVNLGGGTFALPQTLPAFVSAPVLGDFDGNGTVDILSSSGGATAALYNTGVGLFVAGTPPPAAPQAAIDADDDGDLDLVAGQQLYLNVPGTGFVLAPAGALPLSGPAPCFSPGATVVADMDGDGRIDLLDTCGLFHRNVGPASFAAPVAIPYPLQLPLVHGDFDRDGDVDLLGSGMRVLSNATRNLAPGSIARPGRMASLELDGYATRGWQLYASAGRSALPLPPYGLVQIDLATALFVTAGTFDLDGRGQMAVLVPNVPALVGLTVWWQAVVDEPSIPRLTGLGETTVRSY